MSIRSVALVPADRATNVELVTQVATALVSPGPAEIHVLHVKQRTESWRAHQDWRGLPSFLPNSQPARIATATPPARKDGIIRNVRLRGIREGIIPAYAQLTGAHAIVVDRHYGTTPLWRNATVVARMSRWSPVPVLALPPEGPALERLARGNIGRVVVAVDSTFASAVALRTAMALVARHDARLTMIHALENFPGHSVFSGSEAWRVVKQLPAQQREIARRLETQARQFGRADAVAHVITGDAVPGIVSAASETDADLIVMGVAPHTWLDRWISGSTLRGVLRRTRIPVLVVPVVGGNEMWSGTTVVEGAMEDDPSESATSRIAA